MALGGRGSPTRGGASEIDGAGDFLIGRGGARGGLDEVLGEIFGEVAHVASGVDVFVEEVEETGEGAVFVVVLSGGDQDASVV